MTLKASDCGIDDTRLAQRALHLEALRGSESSDAEPEAAHQALLAKLEADVQLLQRATVARFGLLGTLALGVVLAVLGWQSVSRAMRVPPDLAAGKPFTLSSKWADCHPEEYQCGGYPTGVAFHTQQQKNPWYQVDLGAPTTFSSVSVRNRTDAAMWAAVPLVLEVSDDGLTFTELARVNEPFLDWAPGFPARTARFVRVRVDRVSTLHLESVRVHP